MSILHKQNFTDNWISGTNSVHTSNIRDHASSEQHIHAMALVVKEHNLTTGQSLVANASIAVALNKISAEEKTCSRHKFDITYLLAMKRISFRKFPGICELEAQHGVSIENSYITETAARSFMHYITKTKRNQLVLILQEIKYCLLLLDGATDAANVDNELLLAVWFDKDSHSERVCTRISYLKISKLSAASALGLFGVLKEALQGLGIREINKEECTKLVGIGTDGASANVANTGLKGLIENTAIIYK